MEIDVLVEKVKSLRLVVCNKMNLMALGRQPFSKFSGDYTGSSEGWITNNSYP
jgi:hypothetical protein